MYKKGLLDLFISFNAEIFFPLFQKDSFTSTAFIFKQSVALVNCHNLQREGLFCLTSWQMLTSTKKYFSLLLNFSMGLVVSNILIYT